jgi:hypothetical protein
MWWSPAASPTFAVGVRSAMRAADGRYARAGGRAAGQSVFQSVNLLTTLWDLTHRIPDLAESARESVRRADAEDRLLDLMLAEHQRSDARCCCCSSCCCHDRRRRAHVSAPRYCREADGALRRLGEYDWPLQPFSVGLCARGDRPRLRRGRQGARGPVGCCARGPLLARRRGPLSHLVHSVGSVAAACARAASLTARRQLRPHVERSAPDGSARGVAVGLPVPSGAVLRARRAEE